MKRVASLGWIAVCVLLPANLGWAQQGPCLPPSAYPNQNCAPPWAIPPIGQQAAPGTTPGTTPQIGQTPTTPSTEEGAAGDQSQDAMAQAEAGERGTEEGSSFDGPMFGDIVVPASSFNSSLSPQVVSQLQSSGHGGAMNLGGGSAVTLMPWHAGYKLSENEFPRPLDRVFVTYNYYSDVAASGLAYGSPGAQVHRQMSGGEKTFLNGRASIGIRIPIFWVFGSANAVQSQLGDISTVFKYAFYANRRTGNYITGGLVVTAPTGPSLKVPGQSSINSTVLQPWLGDIWHWGRLYNVNFTSFAFTTDARDVNLFFGDFALGYLVYRNTNPSGWLRAVVPDFEVHANIPLNHTSLSDVPIGFPNMVDFTGGCYFFLGRAVMGMAAGTPLTGPRPYGVEALATLNYIF